MKMKLTKIHGQGEQDEEYVSLTIKEDCNLSTFLLSDATFDSKGKVSNKLRHTFWFPYLDVEKGDFVRLYTGKGKNESFNNKSKTQTHYIYWGLATPIWNDTGDGGVLFEISDLDTIKAD